jgi:hypothetical protein
MLVSIRLSCETMGLYFYGGGIDNMLVSIKLSCWTSGTILLWGWH